MATETEIKQIVTGRYGDYWGALPASFEAVLKMQMRHFSARTLEQAFESVANSNKNGKPKAGDFIQAAQRIAEFEKITNTAGTFDLKSWQNEKEKPYRDARQAAEKHWFDWLATDPQISFEAKANGELCFNKLRRYITEAAYVQAQVLAGLLALRYDFIISNYGRLQPKEFFRHFQSIKEAANREGKISVSVPLWAYTPEINSKMPQKGEMNSAASVKSSEYVDDYPFF